MNTEDQPDSLPNSNKDWVNAQQYPDYIVPKCCAPDAAAVPALSVLLCTVDNRAAIFSLLHAEVLRQCEGKPVEVLVACDAKQISIGKKRQNLIEQARGDYVVFIDDDDFIAPSYVEDILVALSTKPDCVGFEIQCTVNGKNPQRAIASMRYKKWADNVDGYAHVRSPYQKTPVKREIALQVGFPDVRYCEDQPYSAGIVKLVKSEVFINKVLYFYKFSNAETFTKKYGFTDEVGKPRVRRLAGGVRGPRYDFKGRRVG